jgi:uncharacterized protein YdiU (UPF0061 family)
MPQIQSQLDIIAEQFCDQYKIFYMIKMRKKLGLFTAFPEDEQLIVSLLTTMQNTHVDFTNTFRTLSQFSLSSENLDNDPILPLILKQTRKKTTTHQQKNLWTTWLKLYRTRLQREPSLSDELQSKRIYMMNHNNPKYILRNYLAQEVIEQAEQGQYDGLKRLFEILTDPYDDLGQHQEFQYDQLPPDWSTQLVLTCSS